MCRAIAEGGARCKKHRKELLTPEVEEDVEVTDPFTITSTKQWKNLSQEERSKFSRATQTKWNAYEEKNNARNTKAQAQRVMQKQDLSQGGDTLTPQVNREFEKVFTDKVRTTVHLSKAVNSTLSTEDRQVAINSSAYLDTQISTEEVLKASRKKIQHQEEAIQLQREELQDPNKRAGRYGLLAEDQSRDADIKVTLPESRVDALREEAIVHGLSTHQLMTRKMLNYSEDKANAGAGKVDVREHTITMSPQARAEREVWLNLSKQERLEMTAQLLTPQQRIENLDRVRKHIVRGNEALQTYDDRIVALNNIKKTAPNEHGLYESGHSKETLKAELEFNHAVRSSIQGGVRDCQTQLQALEATHAEDVQKRAEASNRIMNVIQAGLQAGVQSVGGNRGRAGRAFLTNLIRGVRW